MLRKIFLIFFINLFLFDITYLYSQDVVSLPALLEEAKRNNPEILAAAKRYEGALARIPQAKSLDDPVLGLTFEKTKGSPFQLQKTMSEDRMLSLSQALPFFGKLSLKGKIALVESQMAAAEYKDKQWEIINKVKQAYYDLFMNHKEVELNEYSLAFLEDIAKIAEAEYIVGQVSQEDIFKINLEIAKLSNNIKNLKQERPAKQSRLNALLNRQPESQLGVPNLKEEAVFAQDLTYLYKLTLENQPELLAFSYAIERNRYAKTLAKKSFFPDFVAGIVERGITTGTIGPWDLMLAFTVPLWFWTKQRYQVKEAVANLEEAQAAYQAMKNKALSETKDLFTKIEIAKNKIGLYKNSQIPILESSIETSLSAFRSGIGDIMMLLDSERMLIETKLNYYEALVEYHKNLADLERTAGIDLSEVKK